MSRSKQTVDRWAEDARAICTAIDAQIDNAETLYGSLPVTHDGRANALITALMNAREAAVAAHAQINEIPTDPDVVMVRVDAEVWVRWDRKAKAPIDATVTINTASAGRIVDPADRTRTVPEADGQCGPWREFTREPYRFAPVTRWESKVPPDVQITETPTDNARRQAMPGIPF